VKLKTIILKNFRCYREEIRIPLDDFTAFIGKNDIGKSTILEALEIFFNEDIVKCEKLDACVYGDIQDVKIGCVFSELPDKITIDVRSETTLRDEYLLNEEGNLEIHKIYNCSASRIKGSFMVIANHPSVTGLDNLLLLKNSELKQKLRDLGIGSEGINLRSNPPIRKALWSSVEDLNLRRQEIPLDKEDARKIWDTLKRQMPTYALFQADRKSIDADNEVQDPMKLAVAEALKSVQDELNGIKRVVQEKATEVARRTLSKLKEMDSTLANELHPHFRDEPKWEKIFTLSLTSDNQIPINKRGSGVRRLILLNFFRAEAERKQKETNSPAVIYAIEEPETSQHPNNQRLIVDALLELVEKGGCQVIITTHVPGLAGLLPVKSLRYIDKDVGSNICIRTGDDIYAQIAKDLGVLPDKRVQVLVCVEGPNDVRFLKHIGHILNQSDQSYPNIENDPRIAIIPLGGSTLNEWVQNHYLRPLGLPEIHIYDRDTQTPPQYQDACNAVNGRNDGSWATLTNKREIENYLHRDAIVEIYADIDPTDLQLGDQVNVSEVIARKVHKMSNPSIAWDNLDEEKQKKKIKREKKRLCDDVTSKMTIDRLNEIDPDSEIKGWFRKIARLLR